MRGAVETFARETEPSDSAVERLRGQVPSQIATLREVDELSLARLRARVRRPRPQRGRLDGVLVVALAAGAAAVVLPPLVAPLELNRRLTSTVRTEVTLTPDVSLAYTGTGRVDGKAGAPVIHWDAGTLEVEVAPHAGVDLVVDTLEGHVRVVGTRFAVSRDALGTVVSVRRGNVTVTCGDATPARLEAGGARVCLPTRPAGWLGRAQALRDAGAPDDAVLDAVDRGLAFHPDDAYGELVALRLDVLVVAERYPEALAAAEAYLRSGATARRADVEALVTRLRTRP